MEEFACPSDGCKKSYRRLPDLFQHINASHKFRERWLVIDRKNNRIYVENDVPGIQVRELEKLGPQPQPVAAS